MADGDSFASLTKEALREKALGPDHQAETQKAIFELKYRQITASTDAARWTMWSMIAIAASVVVMAVGVIVDLCKG